MTFQEILEGITRHRAETLGDNSKSEILRKLNEIEWGLEALAEALRDREQELSAVAPHERAGHASDALPDDPPWDEPDEVDKAFDEYEKRDGPNLFPKE